MKFPLEDIIISVSLGSAAQPLRMKSVVAECEKEPRII
jgi:hypothetical protein